MPSSLLYYDAAIHAEPEIFDAKRFLGKERGGRGTRVSGATLRPFGGGGSYCPGRLFAERQLVGFLAGFVERFDVGIEGRVEVPKNADFFNVTAQRDVEVVLRRRECGD
jgi:cytochrome P450